MEIWDSPAVSRSMCASCVRRSKSSGCGPRPRRRTKALRIQMGGYGNLERRPLHAAIGPFRNLLGNGGQILQTRGRDRRLRGAASPGNGNSSPRDRGIGMSPTVRGAAVEDRCPQTAGGGRRASRARASACCFATDFIQRHGGRLSVQTGEGEGTTGELHGAGIVGLSAGDWPDGLRRGGEEV